jgi:nucleotide-binding universal stress UspA family protein
LPNLDPNCPPVVLVATDFSPLSMRAVDCAAVLAARVGAELRLVHVVESIDKPNTLDPETYDFHEQLLSSARTHLSDELKRIPYGKSQGIALLGPRAATLLELANRVKPWMMILGCSLRDYSLTQSAGISFHMLMKAACPILCVPPLAAHQNGRGAQLELSA